jgi:hypothetical protein
MLPPLLNRKDSNRNLINEHRNVNASVRLSRNKKSVGLEFRIKVEKVNEKLIGIQSG